MSMIRHNEGRLSVGVDLGGTQIRVLALTDGRPCGRYQGPTTDENGLGNLLRKLWKRQHWSARTVAALVVAAKGIWSEGERRSLAQRLDGLAGRVLVVPDGQAALLGATGQVAQLSAHLNRAMDNGLTKSEASEALTHILFYAGWPNVFSAIPVAKDVFEKRPR